MTGVPAVPDRPSPLGDFGPWVPSNYFRAFTSARGSEQGRVLFGDGFYTAGIMGKVYPGNLFQYVRCEGKIAHGQTLVVENRVEIKFKVEERPVGANLAGLYDGNFKIVMLVAEENTWIEQVAAGGTPLSCAGDELSPAFPIINRIETIQRCSVLAADRLINDIEGFQFGTTIYSGALRSSFMYFLFSPHENSCSDGASNTVTGSVPYAFIAATIQMT